MTQQKLRFLPNIELDYSKADNSTVKVKGRVPKITYPFHLVDIYPIVPSVSPFQAYKTIQSLLLSSSEFPGFKAENNFSWPPWSPRDDAQARVLLSRLFDPTVNKLTDIQERMTGPSEVISPIFFLNEAKPYPQGLASPQKIMHSLAWIDTNIKLLLEDRLLGLKTDEEACRCFAETAFKIYCTLVKQSDYFLARKMSFNYSMFIQNRIIQLLMGDSIYQDETKILNRAANANRITLELLKRTPEISSRQLCISSVFMGVVWFGEQEFQEQFQIEPEKQLASIDSRIKSMRNNWGINHTDLFLDDMHDDSAQRTCAVVLDDNGESVYDIALFQKLLEENTCLNLDFIVNWYPVSNNISLTAFKALVGHPYFNTLREAMRAGRVRVNVENQLFRSFEPGYFNKGTLDSIQRSDVVYIKGGNFFETLRIKSRRCYHAFTVHGPTSALLTGCEEGQGVFVRVPEKKTTFQYQSHEKVTSLSDMVCNWRNEMKTSPETV